jgi:hypothetical protein
MKKNFLSLFLGLVLSLVSLTSAHGSARYLIPTENPEYKDYAVAPLYYAEFVKKEDGDYRLSYHLPWIVAGFHRHLIELTGALDDLHCPDREIEARCVENGSVPFFEESFSGRVLCEIRYNRRVAILLDDRTGDFLEIVFSTFEETESEARLFLRLEFLHTLRGLLAFD